MRRYSSYSFLDSTLDGVSGQRYAPAALNPRGKDPRCPLERRVASELIWTQRLQKKFFPYAGDGTPVVQSAVWPYSG
jgi:hypothetical protein